MKDALRNLGPFQITIYLANTWLHHMGSKKHLVLSQRHLPDGIDVGIAELMPDGSRRQLSDAEVQLMCAIFPGERERDIDRMLRNADVDRRMDAMIVEALEENV